MYLEPVKYMGFPKAKVLLALKQILWYCEKWIASVYFIFEIPQGYPEDVSCKFDPCVFYRRNDSGIDSVTVPQVDDSFGFGTKGFLEDESITATKYLSKE